jgi:nitrite reductase/ring-hydroxylating ferredoxin subunit
LRRWRQNPDRPAAAAERLLGRLGGTTPEERRALVNVGSEIRAYEDRCPHLGFQLSEGDLDGRTLICANH